MSSYSDVLSTGIKNPTPADMGYFQSNPSAPGRMTEDGHIVLNPYNSLPDAQKATAVRLMLSQGGRDMENTKQLQKLQTNAQNLAAQGRGGDSVLVHMNPAELGALQQIGGAFGRDVTVNPNTGLPEAMGLTDILLGLGIGIATVMTGGAAGAAAAGAVGAGALGTAAGVGAGALAGGAMGAGLNAAKAAVQHKDIGREALVGGVTGALSGGVGAAGSISSAASTGASAAGTTPAAGSAAVTPTGLANAPAGAAASSSSGLGAIKIPEAAMTPDFGSGAATATAPAATNTPSGLAALDPAKVTPEFASAPSQAAAAPSDLNMIQRALRVDNPESGASKAWHNMNDNPMSGSNRAVGMASLAGANFNEQAESAKRSRAASKKLDKDYMNEYSNAMAGFNGPRASLGMAAGGTINDVAGIPSIGAGYLNQQPMPQSYYPQAMIPQAQPMQGTHPVRHDPVLSQAYGGPVGVGYAEGGTTEYGAEGMLRGPGDGQSDGIAAFIHGPDGSGEPVRLAESEFVVPADVVAALGSGSSKAGAAALYDMLNRVRKQAYGHTRQANPVDPSQVLPA